MIHYENDKGVFLLSQEMIRREITRYLVSAKRKIKYFEGEISLETTEKFCESKKQRNTLFFEENFARSELGSFEMRQNEKSCDIF